MEKALSDRKVTLVLVTHDRAFLEALATGLLELDGGKAHFHPFGGNGCYDQFRQVTGAAELLLRPRECDAHVCCAHLYARQEMSMKCTAVGLRWRVSLKGGWHRRSWYRRSLATHSCRSSNAHQSPIAMLVAAPLGHQQGP